MPLPIPAQLAARQSLARRARYLVANNGHAAAATGGWVSNLVGVGVKPQSAHPEPAMRALINASFDRWTDIADSDGSSDFYGLQAIVIQRLVTDGECFAALTDRGGELSGNRWTRRQSLPGPKIGCPDQAPGSA
jgi:capsid protein